MGTSAYGRVFSMSPTFHIYNFPQLPETSTLISPIKGSGPPPGFSRRRSRRDQVTHGWCQQGPGFTQPKRPDGSCLLTGAIRAPGSSPDRPAGVVSLLSLSAQIMSVRWSLLRGPRRASPRGAQNRGRPPAAPAPARRPGPVPARPARPRPVVQAPPHSAPRLAAFLARHQARP